MPVHRPSLLTTAVAVAAVVVTVPGIPSASARSTSSELAAARAATARFHDVGAAIEAGYVPTDLCVPGMGYHYVNPGLFGPELDPAQPEVLLYADKPGGGKRLVGVEYVQFAPDEVPADDPHQVDPDGPALFGQHFNGPMAGHEPGMPTHWDMHVWVWSHNRAGVFAQENEAVVC